MTTTLQASFGAVGTKYAFVILKFSGLPKSFAGRILYEYAIASGCKRERNLLELRFSHEAKSFFAQTLDQPYLENLEEHVLIDADVESEINEEREENG